MPTSEPDKNWCYEGIQWARPIGPLPSTDITFNQEAPIAPITWNDVVDMYHKLTPPAYRRNDG